jgi:hypothetical protein
VESGDHRELVPSSLCGPVACGAVYQVAGEKEGWQLSQELSVPLVTILPEFIMGPVRSKEAAAGSTSVGFMKVGVRGGEGMTEAGRSAAAGMCGTHSMHQQPWFLQAFHFQTLLSEVRGVNSDQPLAGHYSTPFV